MNNKQRTAMIFVLLLSLALSSCVSGQLSAQLSAPATTSTPLPTLTPTFIPPSDTPMPTTVPTEGLTPTSDPGQFIREYFNAVWQTRNYDYLWSLSTPSFKTNANPGGYQEFTDWWGSVNSIDVLNIAIESNDRTHASVDVHVTFHLKDGRVLANRDYLYYLTYDSERQTWMFDHR